MNNPIVTDLFKFVAARPLQLYTKHETGIYSIRDPRLADDPEGAVVISAAKNLANPGEAAQRWSQVDLADIDGWAQARWNLGSACRDLMRQSGPGAIVDITSVTDEEEGRVQPAGKNDDSKGQIWDAIYVAFAHGSEAGRLLEKPIAALQFFHLIDSLPSGETRVDEAIRLLGSRVMIDPLFKESFRPPAVNQPATDEHMEDREDDSSLYRDLAQNLVSTAALLSYTSGDTILGTISPVVNVLPVEGAPEERGGSSAETSRSVSRVPLLKDAMSVAPTPNQTAVLQSLRIQQQTPVHVARKELNDEMSRLSTQAKGLDSVRLRKAVEVASQQFDVEIVPGIEELLPGFGEISVGADDLAPSPDWDSGRTDMSGRITTIGIGELKVVKETLKGYVAGEIAHIENVLKGEKRDRMHRRLDRSETMIYEATEENKESERSTQTTDRFEVKSEAEKTISEQADWKAGLEVSGSYGLVKVTATGEFATKSAKEESFKNSSVFAKEVVGKSLDKVQNRVRRERTTKTITEVEEINTNGIINTDPSATNISGIYRWVDKKYQAQVFNYGRRLLLELTLPEPAAYYRWVATNLPVDVAAEPPHPLVYTDKKTLGDYPDLTWSHISESNYRTYAGRYGVQDADQPPDEYVTVATLLKTEGEIANDKSAVLAADDKFAVPVGYDMVGYWFSLETVRYDNPCTIIDIIGYQHTFGGANSPLQFEWVDPYVTNQISYPVATMPAPSNGARIPLTVTTHDVQTAALSVTAVCRRRDSHLQQWKYATFNKVLTAYDVKKKAYDQAVADARSRTESAVIIRGQNPGVNKTIIETELKKLSISMMTGQYFARFGAIRKDGPKIDFIKSLEDSRIIQFFEQAFEWENLTYLFYPYFWGRSSEWDKLFGSEDADPLFQSFLSAGSVRVCIPAPLAFEDMIRYLLMNPDNKTDLSDLVWKGGTLPDLDDDTYRSLAEEVRDRADDGQDAQAEGQPWTYTVPTTLVWLQQDASPLPTNMDQ